MATTLMSATTAGADDLKDRQNKVEKDIDHAEDDLHSSSKEAREAAAALAAAQKRLGAAQGVLAAAESKVTAAQAEDERMRIALVEAEAELVRAEKALTDGEARTAVQQESVAATITDIYQQGDPALLAFASLLDARTPADLARQNEMKQAIVDREAGAYQELVAARVLLEVQRGQVEDARDAVEVQRQAAAAHLAAMKVLEAEAQAARDAVADLVSARETAAAAAAKARAADEAALAALKREESRIEELLRKRAEARARRQGAAQKVPTPASSGSTFYAPVQGGRLSSPYGMRQHPIYGYWGMHDGQDWAAACGTPLYATADGEVVARYADSVYGNRLFVDHGRLRGVNVSSNYNHATHYVVGVGERVKRGQLVGYVGSTGWSTGCHLHFTVRVNGSTDDPRNWL